MNLKAQGTIGTKRFVRHLGTFSCHAQGTIEEFFRKKLNKLIYNKEQNISMKNTTAQGTIEYLIVVAVVVVIGLVVVSLLASTTDTQNLATTTGRIDTQTRSGIVITEAAVDVAGDSLLLIRNNDPEEKTLTKITIDGKENNFDQRIARGQEILINIDKINNECICEPGEITKTCNYQIEYISRYKITTTQNLATTITCEENISPAKTPTIALNSPPKINLISPVSKSSVVVTDWGNGPQQFNKPNQIKFFRDDTNNKAVIIDYPENAFEGVQKFNNDGIFEFTFSVSNPQTIQNCDLNHSVGYNPSTDANITIATLTQEPFNKFEIPMNILNQHKQNRFYISCTNIYGHTSTEKFPIINIIQTNTCANESNTLSDYEYSIYDHESYCCNENNNYFYISFGGNSPMCFTLLTTINQCVDPTVVKIGDGICSDLEDSCKSPDC